MQAAKALASLRNSPEPSLLDTAISTKSNDLAQLIINMILFEHWLSDHFGQHKCQNAYGLQTDTIENYNVQICAIGW